MPALPRRERTAWSRKLTAASSPVQNISNPKNVTGNKVLEACGQASFTLLLSATPFVVNNIQHVYLPLKMIHVSPADGSGVSLFVDI